ncbi:hypothetical protein NQD34_001501 [Periophthalmus magnuspinnatus]|nr:hypothetical protein NQD34_001501 [Periophthalmus magnuspinnatus]
MQAECEGEEQESGQTEVLNIGKILCTDLDNIDLKEACVEIEPVQQRVSDFKSEIIENTHLEETKSESNTESAYFDTGESQNLPEDNRLDSENVKVYCKGTAEPSEKVELSLNAYIDDQLQKHSEQLQTRIIYLEATDSRKFELFDLQDEKCMANQKDNFGESELRFSEMDSLVEDFVELKPGDHCEMEKHYRLFEREMQRLNAEFENAQNNQVEMAETKSEFAEPDDPDFELEKENIELLDSQDRHSKDNEELILDLVKSEEMDSQNSLSQIEIDTNYKDVITDKTTELCDMQEVVCELSEKVPVYSSVEAVCDSDRQRMDIENGDIQQDEQREMLYSQSVSKLEDVNEKQICKVAEEEITFPETKMDSLGFEKSYEQDYEYLEIQHLLSEMVDTVERSANTSLTEMYGISETHSDSSVLFLEQQIDILETEFEYLQSKIKEMNHAEKQDSIQEEKTATPDTASEIVEPKNYEEKIMQVENISSKIFVQDDNVVSQNETESQKENEKVEFSQPNDSKMQDCSNSKSTPNSDIALKMDKVLELSGKQQIKSSQEMPETVEDSNVLDQPEVQSPVSHKDTASCLNSQLANIENHAIVKAQTEHLLSNLDKIIESSEKILEKTETVEDPSISHQPEVKDTNRQIQETGPLMDTETPFFNSQISNIENKKNKNANTEHLLSNLDKIIEPLEKSSLETRKTVDNQSISNQPEVIDTNPQIQETVPLLDTETTCLNSQISNIENEKNKNVNTKHLLPNLEIIEALKKVDMLDTKLTNSESFEHQNGQVKIPKVQQTNAQVKGPKVKTRDTMNIFDPQKGRNVKRVPTEGPNAVHPKPGLSNGSIPKPPETASLSVLMSLPVPLHLSKSPQSRFNRVLLSSGVLCLPGSRDRSGRAVVTVNPKNPVWASPDCDSTELLQVLLYYLSTLSKEVQALGLIVLVDVRRAPPLPALYTALRSLQEGTPGSVHSVLLFINKDSPIRLDKPPYLQAEMLYSMKSLQKHVDLRQLPVEFGGSFNFSQSSWLCYRARVENLTSQCNNVISLLHKTINMLKTTPLPEDAQKAEQLLSKYKAVMCSILQDSRLVQLQQEGGASLSRLRRDESSISAVESVSSLYDQVDELLHCLVTLSNSKTQEINFILEFTELESGFTEVRRWLEEEGEARLKTLDEPEDSLELLLQHQRDFKDFCPTALDWCKQGQALLKRLEHWDNISSVELKAYEVKVHTFWAQLQDFSQRATATGQNIDRAVRLYSFLDQAYGWALAGMRHLAGITMEDCSLPEKCPVVIRCLEEYNRLHPPIPDSCFQEMRALAGELRGERGLRQWSFAWSKCQETKKMFDRKMEAALRTRDSNSNQRRRSDSEQSKSSSGFSRKSLTLSEPARRGNTGVFIKGLEVSSTEAADRTLCPRTGAQSWVGHAASRSPSTQSINSVSSTAEQRPRGSKLRHIVEEMVTTEREYVRSLRYIIHHYFPEMERPDVPQDLRGKRSVVFGNLEKLLDFHSQFFLKELEACWRHPLRVPHCFLRHQEQFGLYALYSKNKPKSDTLLSHHGNSFFRRKQVELGDKMDLSSYLLKPIQRMSNYALLLSDLIKEVAVSQSQEAELATLHAATNMVKFQLRHGNDLLAMDAIRDCDVNLKEQGQLIRQDEFTVWSGRRKCQRHVFLFEDLILFSKPKRMEGGLDVFIYKHSFKTADVGLTESTGDDGLKFEIWFRRRTSKNQTFLLQAPSSEVKQSWTSDIARLLWNQATRNKEMRLKEMVSMGVGSKPFLDIQPSDAAISDRAVHYIMKSRGARTRASIAVSVFDHSNPFKRSVTSDPSAPVGPSSCSLLGPLNLHMFSQTLPPVGASEGSFINSCIEEDEQEHETSSQPSMTTESSGSSSRCLSGSTGSDSGCVSSHLQEALQEEQNPSQASSSSSSSSSNPPPTNKEHLSSPYISTDAGPVISPATIV